MAILEALADQFLGISMCNSFHFVRPETALVQIIWPSHLDAFGWAEGIGMAGSLSAEVLFKGRHFDQEVVVLCVRWYLRFKFSYRDLVEIIADCGLSLVHTTIMRWVHRYAPEFERRWNRFARPAGGSWRVDETYVKIRGQWVYLYRAVDRGGNTVDFRLSRRRDVTAAKAFFRKALES
jgi:hypothetical protein